jgi:hypothetical protein
MKPNAQLRLVQSSPISQAGEFGISRADEAHIMTILRDTLYSDKVLAVLREYSSNAWDEHCESGKPDLPIEVTMPTASDPTLCIRDFGRGLSAEDIFKVYTQYGASTKRGSDTSVGMLGIGSKSAFAYSDTFTVVSHHDKMKRTYVAVLDKTERGLINLIHEEPTEETGIAIQVAIKPDDIPEFERKAMMLYRFFKPQPKINIEIPPPPTIQTKLTNGAIYDRGDSYLGQWVAIMGCVPYKISLDQLDTVKRKSEAEVGIPRYVHNISGALYFNIGEVEISASREELKYSSKTKEVIIEKFTALVDEYVKNTLDVIDSGNFSIWEKRLKTQVLGQLHLPIPKNVKDLAEAHLEIEEEAAPDSFTISQGNSKTFTLAPSLREETRVIIRNDSKALAGYGIKYEDILIRKKNTGDKWTSVMEELERFIVENKLVGIPVLKTSEMPWNKPQIGRSSYREANPKHKLKLFSLDKSECLNGFYRSTKSDYWNPENRVPTADDVFEIIWEFKVTDYNIFERYGEDLQIAEVFNVDVPTVYGYKSTETKPVDPKTCLGTRYPEARQKWLAGVVKIPRVRMLIEHWKWATLFDTSIRTDFRSRKWKPEGYLKLKAELGIDHIITKVARQHYFSRGVIEKQKNLRVLVEQLEELWSLANFHFGMPEAVKACMEVEEKYPLLYVGVDQTWSLEHSEKWIQYVKIIDTLEKKP